MFNILLFLFVLYCYKMSLIEIILIAVGLAMDCFAVSIASSVCYGCYNWLKILRMALFFGLFQGFMPLIGWACGISFTEFIHSIDHWLALGILGFLGGKMIYESFQDEEDDICDAKTPYGSISMLITLAIATSIDALATGLIFVPLGNLMYSASAIIALVSFLFTIVGCVLGITFGKRIKFNVEAIGGLILIGIGLKIFIEHMFC